MKDCKKKRKAEYDRKRYLENKNKKLKKKMINIMKFGK